MGMQGGNSKSNTVVGLQGRGWPWGVPPLLIALYVPMKLLLYKRRQLCGIGISSIFYLLS